MKKISSQISSILNLLLVIAIGIIVLYILPNTCFNKIFEVLYGLSLAYIASYIFYHVTVVFKEQRDKKNIYPYIHELNSQIINCGECVFTKVAEAAGKKDYPIDRKTITREEYISLCEKVNIDYNFDIDEGISSYTTKKSTEYQIVDYIHYSVEDVQQLIKAVLAYSPHLESELIKILNDISTAPLVRYNFNQDILDELIKDIASDMYDYLRLINRLEEYNKTIEQP